MEEKIDEIEKSDRDWLIMLDEGKVVGNYDDTVRFKRLSIAGYTVYKSDMYAGWWAITEKGRELIKLPF